MAKTRSKKSQVAGTPTKKPESPSTKKNASSAAAASPQPKKAAKQSPKKAAKEEPKESASNASEDSYVAREQLEKALVELEKFVKRQEDSNDSGKSQLFELDEATLSKRLYVEVQKKKFFSRKADIKARFIELPKPHLEAGPDEELKTCLFIRDHFITDEDKLLQVEQAGIPTLSKIFTLTQLKTLYLTFEKRRQLYLEYDLFVVDDAILSSMPATLGKIFFNNDITKFPVSIRVASTKNDKELSLKTLENQVKKALSSTAYMKPVDTTILLPVGSLNFTREDLISNVYAVLKEFDVKELKTVGIKSKDSPVLPLFYTDKIYDDSDVIKDDEVDKAAEVKEDEDAFTKALLELGDEDEVKKALGKEMKKRKKSRVPSSKVSKK